MMKRYVLLDNIRSAFNTGSIFRTADAAGVTKLYLCGITPYPPHIKLEKTALGALESVQWEYTPSALEKIKEIQESGIPVIAVELTPDAKEYSGITYPDSCCLVMGHELTGVSQEILDIADEIVQIPMHGTKNSLNVAVSFGIVIYESIRN